MPHYRPTEKEIKETFGDANDGEPTSKGSDKGFGTTIITIDHPDVTK